MNLLTAFIIGTVSGKESVNNKFIQTMIFAEERNVTKKGCKVPDLPDLMCYSNRKNGECTCTGGRCNGPDFVAPKGAEVTCNVCEIPGC
jgi:hypothetical protein